MILYDTISGGKEDKFFLLWDVQEVAVLLVSCAGVVSIELKNNKQAVITVVK